MSLEKKMFSKHITVIARNIITCLGDRIGKTLARNAGRSGFDICIWNLYSFEEC